MGDASPKSPKEEADESGELSRLMDRFVSDVAVVGDLEMRFTDVFDGLLRDSSVAAFFACF